MDAGVASMKSKKYKQASDGRKQQKHNVCERTLCGLRAESAYVTRRPAAGKPVPRQQQQLPGVGAPPSTTPAGGGGRRHSRAREPRCTYSYMVLELVSI